MSITLPTIVPSNFPKSTEEQSVSKDPLATAASLGDAQAERKEESSQPKTPNGFAF